MKVRAALDGQVDDARRDPAGALVRLGYVLLIGAVLVGALAYQVDIIVAGHALALLVFAAAALMRLRDGAPAIRVPLDVRVLQGLLAATAIGYFAFHFPNGKYTLVSLLNVALLIQLLPAVRLPRVSALALAVFLVVIYGRLAFGVQGLDYVALHSKNYAFLFPLFFLMAHFCEARDHGEPPSMILLAVVALLGLATAGLANGIIGACLLVAGIVMARGRRRVGMAVTAAVALVLAWQGGPVRDSILAFHLAGPKVSALDLGQQVADFVVLSFQGNPTTGVDADRPGEDSDRLSDRDRRLAVEYNVLRLGETVRAPGADERFDIWRSYLESASRPSAFMLGGLSGGIDTSTSLHSSYLSTHQKFGLLGLAVVAICGVLFFRLGLYRVAFGWILAICCLRAGTDSIMFIGGYFDFVLIGVTVAVGIKLLHPPAFGMAAAPRVADRTAASTDGAAWSSR